MAADAKAHEIVLLVCPAIRKGSAMMDKGRNSRHALPKAHLAEGIAPDVSVANLPPRRIVPLVLVVPSDEMLVVPLHLFPMLLAVA